MPKSAAHRDTIDQPEAFYPFLTMRQRKSYNKWRLRILFYVILGYATYYLCRMNFSMIMPAFMEEFGYNKTEMGLLLTVSSIVYGIGKFINGYVSDRSDARYFMPLGLVCSALMSLILGFSNGLMFLGAFWILNNWFQSMGWPPAARMLTHWFSHAELGTKWAYGAASHQVGGAVTLVVSGYLVTHFGWRSAFFVPAFAAIIVAYILFKKLSDSPKEQGFPPVEAYKGVNMEKSEENSDEHLPTLEILRNVFCSKKMWFIACANMCLYAVRLGITFWAPLFLKEFKNVSLAHAGWQVASYELAGLFGGIFAGFVSDKFFRSQRGPVGVIFMLCLALGLFAFWKMPAEYGIYSGLILAMIGFFVYGPQILVGVASADFASKKAIGTANGFAGTMGYLGSGLSGVLVGWISDEWGWDYVFIFFIACAILGSIFFYLTWDHNDRESKQKSL